jgi:hypothetical protein
MRWQIMGFKRARADAGERVAEGACPRQFSAALQHINRFDGARRLNIKKDGRAPPSDLLGCVRACVAAGLSLASEGKKKTQMTAKLTEAEGAVTNEHLCFVRVATLLRDST